MSVLDPLIECWEHHEQGMTVESFDALNQALASPLEALAVMPVAQAGLACDQLKMAWGKLRGRLEWIE
ncbi:hypothetical protein [Sorangium sp. So ce204]|uniref:hypothetical protein n=1 Tax=Sorangium sp. So ce204 TaxID=3133288 RepID=UPI003F61E9D5